MVFSDSNSPQVSRTLLSILGVLNNAVVWMVSTRPLISNSSSPCTDPLVTVPIAPIKIGITVSFMFHSVFSSLAGFRYLPIFSFSCSFTQLSARTAKSSVQRVPFVLLTGFWLFGENYITHLYLKIPKDFVCLIFLVTFWVVHFFFVWSNLNSLHDSQWFTSPTPSYYYYYYYYCNTRNVRKINMMT